MEIERLPNSFLNGNFLHCRPVEDGRIVEAQILPSEEESTPTFKVGIICPAREPRSRCRLRIRAGSGDDHCQYWRGDSLGEYQIIGPDMDKKSNKGWT